MKITRKQLKRIIKEELNRITENPEHCAKMTPQDAKEVDCMNMTELQLQVCTPLECTHQKWELKLKEFNLKVNDVLENTSVRTAKNSIHSMGTSQKDALDGFFARHNKQMQTGELAAAGIASADDVISFLQRYVGIKGLHDETISIEAFMPDNDGDIQDLLLVIPSHTSFNDLTPIINELLRLGTQFKKLFDSEQ
jgi:hypothetical protein